MSKIIFMKYLSFVRPEMIPKLKILRIYWNLANIFPVPRARFWCQKFIKYLPRVWTKPVPKLKVLRIYSNLVYSIFQICSSRFWCQKWFLLNIRPKHQAHLLGPNWSQNYKCSGFIEIWHIWYFEYQDLDLDVENYYISNIYQLLGPNWSQNEKRSEFLTLKSKLGISNVYLKYQICQISRNSEYF